MGIFKANSDNPALIIIDLQNAIDAYHTGTRNNPDAESNIARLLAHWRKKDLPIFHIRHASKSLDSPYHKNSPLFDFKDQATPRDGEQVITKSENCAFIDTDLNQQLKNRHISELVICGVLSNNSVDATVRVGAALGYKIIVPHDSSAAFDMTLLNGEHIEAEQVHWIFLSNLDGEYCQVCGNDELLANI